MNLSNLLSTALSLGITAHASAAITVTGYNYLSSPSSPYTDSGSELTDEVDAVPAWGSGFDPSDITPFCGWQAGEPSINFQFASATIQSFEVWVADSNGARGVAVPDTITIRTSDSSFSQTFNVVDPAGDSQTVRLHFSGFSVNTDHLILESADNSSVQWTMLTEVRFFETVPEPGSSLLILIATAPLLLSRRRAR
ncbi:MAG: PEP-CTERM sorting domain-containing protein [Verrucomicrobiaceae bacterium]